MQVNGDHNTFIVNGDFIASNNCRLISLKDLSQYEQSILASQVDRWIYVHSRNTQSNVVFDHAWSILAQKSWQSFDDISKYIQNKINWERNKEERRRLKAALVKKYLCQN